MTISKINLRLKSCRSKRNECLCVCLTIIIALLSIFGNNAVLIESNGFGETYYGISSNGSLVGWGSNEHSLIGKGNLPYYPFCFRKKFLNHIGQLDIGYRCAMAIDNRNCLWGWDSEYALLFREADRSLNRPVKIMDGVIDVGVGNFHAAVVLDDGSLWTWGYNRNGEIGLCSRKHKLCNF